MKWLIGATMVVALTACGFQELTPARWQCGDHPYYINSSGAPAGGVDAVHEAVRQVNVASAPRVHFHYAGTTMATSAQAGKVIYMWANLPSGTYAQGAPQPWPNNVRWTGGIVQVDPRYPANLGTLLHESGHALGGLAHVDDRNQVMNPIHHVHSHMTHYGDGDLEGFRTFAAECR